MGNLEQYVKDNREHFDFGELPVGSRDRFMFKLEEARKAEELQKKYQTGKRSYFIAAAAGIAAVMLMVIFIGPGKGAADSSDYYMDLMTSLDKEILDLSKNYDEKTADEIARASKSIIYDTIPLEEQLPEDMREEEKEIIMREYYEKKAEGLRRIKNQLNK